MKKRFWAIPLMMALLLTFVVACGGANDAVSEDTSDGGANDDGEDVAEEGDGYEPELNNILLASGPIGANWYAGAAAIAELLMQEIDGLNVTVTEGGGEANIEEVANGNAHIGYTYSDTLVSAVHGLGNYEGNAHDNLVGFGTLSPSYFHAITTEDNKKVQSLEDLTNGVHLLPGEQTFSGQVFTKNLLENHYGITYEDIEKDGKISYTGYTEMTDLLRDGHADVATAMTSVPSSFVMELESVKDIRFLEVDPEIAKQVQEENSGFVPAQIPAGGYDSVTEPIDTVGAFTVLVVRDDFPEELGKRITEVILENRDKLEEANPTLDAIDPETYTDIFVDVDVHPGVEQALGN